MLYLILVATLNGPAAGDRTSRHATANFIVEAPSKEAARMIGKHAEAEREWLAALWLGKEAPVLQQRCLIRVKAGKGKASGATTFAFDDATLFAPNQQIVLDGPIAELAREVLPQEVMHTLLAQHLGAAHPRWVQTGAGIMARSEREQKKQLEVLRTALASEKVMRLSQLFDLQEFPSDWQTMFAQSFAVTRFLVERKDRTTYLAFVQRGMQHGWDDAVQRHYSFDNVAALEAGWLKSLEHTK